MKKYTFYQTPAILSRAVALTAFFITAPALSGCGPEIDVIVPGDSNTVPDSPSSFGDPDSRIIVVEKEEVSGDGIGGGIFHFPRGLDREPFDLEISTTLNPPSFLLIGTAFSVETHPVVLDVTDPTGTHLIEGGIPSPDTSARFTSIRQLEITSRLATSEGWFLIDEEEMVNSLFVVNPAVGTWRITVTASSIRVPFAVGVLAAPLTAANQEAAEQSRALVEEGRDDAPLVCTACGYFCTLVSELIPLERIIRASDWLTQIQRIIKSALVALRVEIEMAEEAAGLVAHEISNQGAAASANIIDTIITDALCVHVLQVCPDDYVHTHETPQPPPDLCGPEGALRCVNGLPLNCSRIGSHPYDHLEWVACEGCMCPGEIPGSEEPPTFDPDDFDGDGIEDERDCAANDPLVGMYDLQPCETICGSGERGCENGRWSSCSAPTSCCGDGNCNNGETCGSCSSDCGVCHSSGSAPANPPPVTDSPPSSSEACVLEAEVSNCWGCPNNPIIFGQRVSPGTAVTASWQGGPDPDADYRTRCERRNDSDYGRRNFQSVISRFPLGDGRARILADISGGTGEFPGSEGWIRLQGPCHIAEVTNRGSILTMWEGQYQYGSGVQIDQAAGAVSWSGRGGCPACDCLENGLRLEFIVEMEPHG